MMEDLENPPGNEPTTGSPVEAVLAPARPARLPFLARFQRIWRINELVNAGDTFQTYVDRETSDDR
jgi:hypothetical protein